MKNSSMQSQQVLDTLARRVPVFSAVRQDRDPQSNIWFFDSPKNNKRLTISTDLAFLHAVRLEGNLQVSGYEISPSPFVVQDGTASHLIELGATVQMRDGAIEWWDFQRLKRQSATRNQTPGRSSEKDRAAATRGAVYVIKTDADLEGEELAIDNWLLLCAAITRCRGHFLARETEVLMNLFARRETITLNDLLAIEGIDMAYMLAAVAIALQRGIASTELSRQLLDLRSVIKQGPPDQGGDGSTSGAENKSQRTFEASIRFATPSGLNQALRGATRRRCIPEDCEAVAHWPQPDLASMERDVQDAFHAKRRAIEMYAAGDALSAIEDTTGVTRGELYRHLRRCLSLANDGNIFGLRALVPGTRTAGYTRTADVVHVEGSGSGGCSGALSQLFGRYPEVEALVIELFFKSNSRVHIHEARISISTVHEQFKKALRALGLTDDDWPFNTANTGYKTLYLYCQRLRQKNANATVMARAGIEASLRSRVGNGEKSLMPRLRPYGGVQLDFHKVDAASVIVLTNDHGTEFEVPLSRWYFGLILEERYRAVIGFNVVLELNPSADSTLDVVSNALSTRQAEFSPAFPSKDGAVVISQLIPELEYQTFSVLKVDNAWANAAHEVVNNIIDTIGCAVNFGPSRAWYRRPLIEHIFGELTRRGLQRLPSTHGARPGDTKIDHPNAQAAKFRIGLEDLIGIFRRCIRERNLKGTEADGMQFTAPAEALHKALSKPASGLFRQPLPRASQAHAKLMMHIEEVTVRGNIKKQIRPYFNLGRHKHTNIALANSWHLIGEVLVAYLDRRLARIVYATVKNTGEDLGRMTPSGAWARSNCSWRDRQLMMRAGLSRRYGAIADDPLDRFKEDKIEELRKRRKSAKNRSSKLALTIEKIEAQQRTVANMAGSQIDPVLDVTSGAEIPKTKSDPFDLRSIPDID